MVGMVGGSRHRLQIPSWRQMLPRLAGGLSVKVPELGDTGTTVSYQLLRTSGRGVCTRSPALMQQACELWQWCLHRGITLSAEYLSGSQNKVVDEESRVVQTAAEWKLNSDVFLVIQRTLGPCAVDLFTTRLNPGM